MSFFNSMNVAASGLTAQRARMDVHAQNLANIDTTRTPEGGPYQRRVVVFEERRESAQSFAAIFDRIMQRRPGGSGVRVHSIVTDETPGPMVYDPGHPDANAQGYVLRPNVNVIGEMVNMISASRSYEANITSINITRAMMNRTLEMSGR
ncbi:MAG: flagellar basal body rod protein FlgC [Clostridiales bacterium]|jgi:flagellar basal-body rod protein FlgC|nr:flagellar basal body rod protein FlgC [Clostridiales bacterium]